MITAERTASFIRSLEQEKTPLLSELRKEALEDSVPILRPETEALLLFCLEQTGARHILEVGTAVGYSACVMAERLPEGGHIDTIENYPPRIEKARAVFERAGVTDRVTLYEGDASEILRALEGPYELIFMDAAKAQYIRWLPDCLRLLPPGGLLFSDNVLQDGDLLEPRSAVERRNRTIYDRMREYLYTLTHSEELQSAVVPVGDGVALSVKKRKH